MAVKFDPSIPLIDVMRAARVIGAELVNDGDGNIVIVRRHFSGVDDAAPGYDVTSVHIHAKNPVTRQTYFRAVTLADGLTHLLQGGPGRKDGGDRYWGDLVWCRAEPIDEKDAQYTQGPVTCKKCVAEREQMLREWRLLGMI